MSRVFFLIVFLSCFFSACQPSTSSGCQASEFALPANVSPMNFACGKAIISNPASKLEIAVEITRTNAESERGLMYHTKLPEKQGMYFTYPKPVDPKLEGIWMKNTLIPLDVAFIDANGVIFDIATLQPCLSANCLVYTTKKTYVAVLEVNAGFFSQVGMGLNANIKLEP